MLSKYSKVLREWNLCKFAEKHLNSKLIFPGLYYMAALWGILINYCIPLVSFHFN